MQKIEYMLLVGSALTSCSMKSDSYTIKVDLEDAQGKWVK